MKSHVEDSWRLVWVQRRCQLFYESNETRLLCCVQR